jgi:uncharacterized protein YecE (DUF72 family)
VNFLTVWRRWNAHWPVLAAAARHLRPRDLPALWQFLDTLPNHFTYGVEVRHPEFFAKGEAEKQLNRGLHQRNVNRVILDSRPVHSAVAKSGDDRRPA